MFNSLFINKIVNSTWFVGGLFVATVVWFFVLRNNKKHFNEWMGSTEEYLMGAINKIDGISEEASAKINAVFAGFKDVNK